MWRKLLVVILVTLTAHVPRPGVCVMAQSMGMAKETQQQVAGAGVGSYVALELVDGKKLKGRLEVIGERRFTMELLGSRGARLQVGYEGVTKLREVKRTSYRARGQPNAELARQAIDGLGVATHVMVKLPDERVLRGHIQAIDERRFVLRLDTTGQPTPISYGQVKQVRENPHVPILIGVFTAVGALVALLVLVLMKESGHEPFVSTIDASTIQAGQTVNVRITGNNFAAGATVKFKNGGGRKPIASSVVVVDANTITATVTVDVPAPSRNRIWDVVVTNSDRRTGKLKDCFTVTP